MNNSSDVLPADLKNRTTLRADAALELKMALIELRGLLGHGGPTSQLENIQRRANRAAKIIGFAGEVIQSERIPPVFFDITFRMATPYGETSAYMCRSKTPLCFLEQNLTYKWTENIEQIQGYIECWMLWLESWRAAEPQADQKKAGRLKPLTDDERIVLDSIPSDGSAVPAKQIIHDVGCKLPGIDEARISRICTGTLKAYGVKNRRGVGYYRVV